MQKSISFLEFHASNEWLLNVLSHPEKEMVDYKPWMVKYE